MAKRREAYSLAPDGDEQIAYYQRTKKPVRLAGRTAPISTEPILVTRNLGFGTDQRLHPPSFCVRDVTREGRDLDIRRGNFPVGETPEGMPG